MIVCVNKYVPLPKADCCFTDMVTDARLIKDRLIYITYITNCTYYVKLPSVPSKISSYTRTQLPQGTIEPPYIYFYLRIIPLQTIPFFSNHIIVNLFLTCQLVTFQQFFHHYHICWFNFYMFLHFCN